MVLRKQEIHLVVVGAITLQKVSNKKKLNKKIIALYTESGDFLVSILTTLAWIKYCY